MITPVKRGSSLLVIDLREGHGTTAKLAGTEGLIGSQFNITATHFTFDNCHDVTSLL
jgi:hypothetical protein